MQDLIALGEYGWVYKAFCHVLLFVVLSGQKVFTVFSLHINNDFAKKRGIAKKIVQTMRALMISQDIDLVAGLQWCSLALSQP